MVREGGRLPARTRAEGEAYDDLHPNNGLPESSLAINHTILVAVELNLYTPHLTEQVHLVRIQTLGITFRITRIAISHVFHQKALQSGRVKWGPLQYFYLPINKECLAVGYVLFVRGRRLSFWPRSALTRSLRSPRCGRRQVHEFSRLFPYLNIEDSCFIYSCLQEPRSLPAQACSELPNPNWKPNPTPNLQKNQTNQFSRQPQNQGPSSFQNHPKPSFSVQKPIQPPRPASTQAVPMSWRTSNPNFHNMETGQETGNELENPGDNETENQIEYDQNYASDQEHFLDDTGLPQEFPDSN
ncbi:unnamed protein product [Nesidiocoris tenuis]|uniref:Uncharacterized protein n=1 Tax=Nesidiocoris tenuis TaxID=355587 RepID=A0A6H5G2U8_9HEMI|nr:unnamed protein product [Nesidiocoris tenuis]